MEIRLCENYNGFFFLIMNNYNFAAIDKTIASALNISVDEYRARLKTFTDKTFFYNKNTYLLLDASEDEKVKYYEECFKNEFAAELMLLQMGGWYACILFKCSKLLEDFSLSSVKTILRNPMQAI